MPTAYTATVPRWVAIAAGLAGDVPAEAGGPVTAPPGADSRNGSSPAPGGLRVNRDDAVGGLDGHGRAGQVAVLVSFFGPLKLPPGLVW